MHQAVFLDRDETLIRADSLPPPPPPANPGDVVDPEQVQLLPGVQLACKRLKDAGFQLIIYSSQGGVARGAIGLRTVEAINDRLRSLLGPGILDSCYWCPFHPKGKVAQWTRPHDWQKPGPGMLISAARELDIDLSRSWAIGDRQRDIDSAIAAGLSPDRCLLIGPGTPIPDMNAAADRILNSNQPATAATMRMRALQGAPLADPRTRATVIATAGAIAERTGIPLIAVQADNESLTISLAADRLAGLGFLAELRRATNTWYSARNNGDSLWGEPAPDQRF